MAILPKIYPKSPDPYLERLGRDKSRAALARLAHIGPMIDQINENTIAIESLVQESPLYIQRDLTSPEISNMGLTPIQMLPVAGINQYYEVVKSVLEYTYNGIAYTLPDSLALKLNTSYIYSIPASIITDPNSSFILVAGTYAQSVVTNSSLNIGIVGNVNPGGGGNGTLLVKVWYYLRTIN